MEEILKIKWNSPGERDVILWKLGEKINRYPWIRYFTIQIKNVSSFGFFFSCIHNVATKIFCPLELCVTLCLQRNRERNGRRITSVNLLVLVCYKEKKILYSCCQWLPNSMVASHLTFSHVASKCKCLPLILNNNISKKLSITLNWYILSNIYILYYYWVEFIL